MMPQSNIITFEQLMGTEKSRDNDELKQVEELEDHLSDKESNAKQLQMGQCKSGRFWKTPKDRFKTIVKTRGLKTSLEQRRKIQDDIKKAKQLTRDALDARNKEKEEHRQRRIANLKKREENAKKSEVVQVIKNPSKVKRKHLRMIQKRDTLPLLNKSG